MNKELLLEVLSKTEAGFVYVAGPYTHEDPNVRHERYLQHMKYAMGLTRKGRTAYSPIVHFHEMAKLHDMPHEAKFWHSHNLNMLLSAAELHVIQLPGWETSSGLQFEIAAAAGSSMRITHVKEEELWDK